MVFCDGCGTNCATFAWDVTFKNEINDSPESIKSITIPTPLILLKDHKKKKNGLFPICLHCPTTNFVAIFDNIGHEGIKNVLDRNGVNYELDTIVQASNLKEDMER